MSITIQDLTTKEVSGSGVFDCLMSAVTLHLEQEYQKDRIHGAEYAAVYTEAIQASIQQSIAFLSTQAQVDLIAAQTRVQEQQILKGQQEIALLNAQVAKSNKEVDLLTAQIAQAYKQNALIDQQIINAEKQNDKTDAEIELLNCKKKTETAQINGDDIQDNSVLGRQLALYAEQAEGYKRDARHKLMSKLVDMWAVQRSTDSGITPSPLNLLDDTSIGLSIREVFENMCPNDGNLNSRRSSHATGEIIPGSEEDSTPDITEEEDQVTPPGL